MKQSNKTTIKILTVGVYDLLHIGHILLFKKAKSLGDKLIVAVQDADFIKKYKPEADIINSTDERMFAVSSIKYVDNVIIYKSVDNIIKEVDFDIFVKGPDQNHQGFQEAIKWCEQNRKKIVTIPRTENISSSLLRTYINNNERNDDF